MKTQLTLRPNTLSLWAFVLRCSRQRAVICLLPSAFCLSALAQGTAFTYQGRLNEGAHPANGIYDFQFSVHAAASAGVALGAAITTNGVAVSNGLFTVTLDFGAGIFTGAARWLEIGVKSNGIATPYQTLAPRLALTPSPYAVYAGGAQTAAAVAAGAVNSATIADGAIAAGDLSPSLLQGTFWRIGGNTGPANVLGTVDNEPLDVRVNNQRALRLEPGASSPTLVGGFAGNASSGVQGGFIGGGGAAGAVNTLSNDYAAIVGGSLNVAAGLGSFIGGGSEHEALGPFATVAGGFRNTARADYSAVVGGVENSAAGWDAFVGAGGGNHAGPNYSAVVGGLRNKLFGGDYAFMGGGYENRVSGGADYAVMVGGKNNTNTAAFATISGGTTNEVTAANAVIGGGSRNQVTALHGVVGGGYYNLNWETNGTIAGGSGNRLYGDYGGSTISGGINNVVAQTQAGTIAGGIQNHIFDNSPAATVGGGYQNFIEDFGANATIAGGYFNLARASYASIGGGHYNTNSGSYSAIPGGSRNRTLGDYSFAGGRRAKADHDGTFVWADDNDANFASTGARQFLVRASGGVGINTSNPQATLHVNGSVAAQALRAPGAGINTGTFAFTHRAMATNTSGHITTIYNPLTDGDPNAILVLTHNWSADTNSVSRYATAPVGVYYNGNRWTIFNEDLSVMGLGRAFNVMVIKP